MATLFSCNILGLVHNLVDKFVKRFGKSFACDLQIALQSVNSTFRFTEPSQNLIRFIRLFVLFVIHDYWRSGNLFDTLTLSWTFSTVHVAQDVPSSAQMMLLWLGMRMPSKRSHFSGIPRQLVFPAAFPL